MAAWIWKNPDMKTNKNKFKLTEDIISQSEYAEISLFFLTFCTIQFHFPHFDQDWGCGVVYFIKINYMWQINIRNAGGGVGGREKKKRDKQNIDMDNDIPQIPSFTLDDMM